MARMRRHCSDSALKRFAVQISWSNRLTSRFTNTAKSFLRETPHSFFVSNRVSFDKANTDLHENSFYQLCVSNGIPWDKALVHAVRFSVLFHPFQLLLDLSVPQQVPEIAESKCRWWAGNAAVLPVSVLAA